MSNPETIVGIIAEMRGPKFYPWGQGGFSVEMDLTPLADRLEAAWKREKAAIEADALAVGGLVEASRATTEKSSAVGDAAKMREALDGIKNTANSALTALSFGNDTSSYLWDIIRECASAISAPPRNCDKFGTDNAEASLAYEEFCDRAEVEESVNGAIAWLLSLDADKKGGAK